MFALKVVLTLIQKNSWDLGLLRSYVTRSHVTLWQLCKKSTKMKSGVKRELILLQQTSKSTFLVSNESQRLVWGISISTAEDSWFCDLSKMSWSLWQVGMRLWSLLFEPSITLKASEHKLHFTNSLLTEHKYQIVALDFACELMLSFFFLWHTWRN